MVNKWIVNLKHYIPQKYNDINNMKYNKIDMK